MLQLNVIKPEPSTETYKKVKMTIDTLIDEMIEPLKPLYTSVDDLIKMLIRC